MPSRDYLIGVKLSFRQWKEFLGDLSPGRRSAYVRTAIETYMAEQQPVLRYIPVEEPPDELIRPSVTQVVGTAAIDEWFANIPSQIKSYMIRQIINWYRAKLLAESDPQARFDLEAPHVKSTGTATDQ